VSEPSEKTAAKGEGGKPVPGAPTNVPGGTGTKPPPPAPPPAGKPPAPPKNPGFVTLTIDEREVVVKPGTNMIEAAKQVGSEIPYYCYHPRLTIAANCRMCLVEVSNAPKLVPACQTPVAEGLVVKTKTEVVKDSHRAVLEFLLLNHPVDCAICDQAGECKLQDYYMQHDFQPSRLDDRKVLRHKRKALGPLVVLDQERCILCTRCVRFMNEVAKEPQLGVFGRGSHERIDVFPGSSLDSNYSGNTVDICPVGALLSRDFRFRARAWFLSTSPSVCSGCSRGCSTWIDFFGQETYRYRPRENEQINKSWLCDQGRLSYKYLNRDRVLAPALGRGSDAQEIGAAEAMKWAWGKLEPIARTPKLAVLASPLASNEDLMFSLSFAKEALGASQVYLGGRPPGDADHYLMTSDKNPNRRGLEWIARGLGLATKPFEEVLSAIEAGSVRALYAVGGEIPSHPPAIESLLQRLELLIVQAINPGALSAFADLVLPVSPHSEDEGTFTNLDGITQRFWAAYPSRGASQPHWKWEADLARAAGHAWVPSSAGEVFGETAKRIPELASFDWDGAAPLRQLWPAGGPLPAAADGRPAGYREFGRPRVRGI